MSTMYSNGTPKKGCNNGLVSGTDNTASSVSSYFKKALTPNFWISNVKKRLPILKWGPLYNAEDLQGDLVAGITVGLTVIPQGMAYATVAGVLPNYGLYSAFMGCLVYMLFGSSKDITIGPTAIMSLMTYQFTRGIVCIDQEFVAEEMAGLLTLVTAVVILLATVLQIGFLINFIGRPVISGFTSAAAITIGTTQIKSLLGIKIHSEGFTDTWYQTFLHINETRWQDFLLGLICCAILLFMKNMREFAMFKPSPDDTTVQKIYKKTIFLCSVGRNALVVLFCCGLTATVQGLGDDAPFTIVGHITPGMPTPGLPQFTLTCNGTNGTLDHYNFLEIMGMYGVGSIIVPLLAILENIAIASAFAHGKAIDATQEMFALGMCNFAGAFFKSIPTTGSFSRTAVNATSGVRTTAGGVATGLVVILALLFLTPIFGYIPKASLAAVIICAVIFMVEYHDIMPIWRTCKLDQLPLWSTFLACLFWGLEFGILLGTGIHILILLYQTATPTVTLRYEGAESRLVVQPAFGIVFPNSETVKKFASKAGLRETSCQVVLDCCHVTAVDYTSATAIMNLLKEFKTRGQGLAFANLHPKVRASLLHMIPDLVETNLEQFCDKCRNTNPCKNEQKPDSRYSLPNLDVIKENSASFHDLYLGSRVSKV